MKGLFDAGGHDPNKMSFTQHGDGVIDSGYHNLGRHGSMKMNIKKLQ